MKQATAIFFLCLVLVLGCTAAWALPVYQSRDQVEVTAETLAGDPAAVQDLTIRQVIRYDAHLFWDLEIPAHAPQESVTDFSYTVLNHLERMYYPASGVHLQSMHSAYYSNHRGVSLDEALDRGDADIQALAPVFVDVASRAPNGEPYTETLPLTDYLDSYPLILYVDYPYEKKMCKLRLGDVTIDSPSIVTYDDYLRFFRPVTQDFFSLPFDPEDLWEITVQKTQEGEISQLNAGKHGLLRDFYTLSAVTETAGYFAFSDDTHIQLDYSRVPGGCGIYRVDLTPEADYVYAELDTLTNVCPLPEGSVVLDLTLAADGSSLFAVYGLGETYTLLILDPDTGAVRQTFPVPAHPPEPEQITSPEELPKESLHWDILGSLWTEDFYLLYGSYTLHLFLRGEDGSYTHQFSVDSHGICPTAGAWNGERLALAAPPNRNAFDNSVVLSVLDPSGELLYLGRYETSLDALASEQAKAGDGSMTSVTLMTQGGLTLTWN